MNIPRNGSSWASIWCLPGPIVPTTWPVLTNRAISSASTIARVNLRMRTSGHLKTICFFLSSGTAMNSRLSRTICGSLLCWVFPQGSATAALNGRLRERLDKVTKVAQVAAFRNPRTVGAVLRQHRVACVPVGTGFGVEPPDVLGAPGYFSHCPGLDRVVVVAGVAEHQNSGACGQLAAPARCEVGQGVAVV